MCVSASRRRLFSIEFSSSTLNASRVEVGAATCCRGGACTAAAGRPASPEGTSSPLFKRKSAATARLRKDCRGGAAAGASAVCALALSSWVAKTSSTTALISFASGIGMRPRTAPTAKVLIRNEANKRSEV